MTRPRFVCAVSAVTLAVMAPFTVAAAGATTEPGAESHRSGTGESDLPDVVIASGQTDFPATRVVLLAWPAEDVLAAQEVGEELRLTEVDSVTPAADGSFDLSVPADVDLQRHANGGYVDLTVAAVGLGGATASHAVSINIEDLRNARLQHRQGAVPGLTQSNLALTRLTGPQGSTVDGPTLNSTLPMSGYSEKSFVCSTQLRERLGNRRVIIGEGYNTSSVRHLFTFTGSSNTTLGIGVSLTGNYGSWKSAGTVTRSGSTTVDYPQAPANVNRVYSTNYSYGLYRIYCAMGGMDPTFTYEVRPIAHQGGVFTTSPSSIPSTSTKHCTGIPRGTVITINRSTATTFTHGASLKSVIGIDLSSQAGFSSSTKIRYNFDQARRICGLNGSYANAPGRVWTRP